MLGDGTDGGEQKGGRDFKLYGPRRALRNLHRIPNTGSRFIGLEKPSQPIPGSLPHLNLSLSPSIFVWALSHASRMNWRIAPWAHEPVETDKESYILTLLARDRSAPCDISAVTPCCEGMAVKWRVQGDNSPNAGALGTESTISNRRIRNKNEWWKSLHWDNAACRHALVNDINLNSHAPKSYGGEQNNANVIALYSLERKSPIQRISKPLIICHRAAPYSSLGNVPTRPGQTRSKPAPSIRRSVQRFGTQDRRFGTLFQPPSSIIWTSWTGGCQRMRRIRFG